MAKIHHLSSAFANLYQIQKDYATQQLLSHSDIQYCNALMSSSKSLLSSSSMQRTIISRFSSIKSTIQSAFSRSCTANSMNNSIENTIAHNSSNYVIHLNIMHHSSVTTMHNLLCEVMFRQVVKATIDYNDETTSDSSAVMRSSNVFLLCFLMWKSNHT